LRHTDTLVGAFIVLLGSSFGGRSRLLGGFGPFVPEDDESRCRHDRGDRKHPLSRHVIHSGEVDASDNPEDDDFWIEKGSEAGEPRAGKMPQGEPSGQKRNDRKVREAEDTSRDDEDAQEILLILA